MFQLQGTQPVAHAVGVLALVCFGGMALGSVKFRGVGLGTAGVLFAGIVTGHFGKPVDKATLDFIKEFGLVLFVFAIGLQLGPGFFAALRKQGFKLNLMAMAIVLLGAAGAPLAGWLAGFDPAASLGIFSGASVNMPSLGAATQTLGTLPNIAPERLALPALACAVTFPTAIVASIGTLLLLQAMFRINPAHEAAEHAARNRRHVAPLERRTFVVSSRDVVGLRVDEIPGRVESSVTIARVRRGSETSAARGSTILQKGDLIAAVGTAADLEEFEKRIGPLSDEDLLLRQTGITFRRVVVTAGKVLGKDLRELNLDQRFGVAMTRITRADVEMIAVPGIHLQFGDTVQIVGTEENLEQAARALGNSLKELNETHFIPLFIGIFLGVALGTLPIVVPGLPQPVRLGLAGGPLIIALLLGRLGRIGSLACHMPVNANLAFRDFGIALFFAAVGLDAGAEFFTTVFSPMGLQWLLAGACVTAVPLLIVGIVARAGWGMNFVDISGLLAGSTTNPPALAFATGMTGSDAPTVAYATVYPLVMLMRILCAQVITLVLLQ
ncbi:MAG: putative transporter [Verrucomicrobiae bacterium]|nr:putative transporter [Verrucomicrobiae bacterium]